MPGSPRLFGLCRELSRQHRIFLLARGAREEPWRWFLGEPEVAKVFAEVTRLPDPPPFTWRGQQHHRLRQACTFSTLYRTPEYHRRLREVIGEEMVRKRRIDLVYVDSLAMTQYVDGRNAMPIMVDLHDCLTLLNERTTRNERRWWRKLALYLETRSIARW